MNTVPGRRTRILAATTATAGLLLVAGCSSDDGGGGSTTAAGGVELVKGGQLTTCTHLPYPPFQSEIDGKVQGFDVALIDLVAKELGVKQEIVDTPFENFKTGAFLNSGKCDLGRGRHDHHRGAQEERRLLRPVLRRHPGRPGRQGQRHHLARRPQGQERSSAPRRRPPARTTPRGKGLDPVSFESSDAVLNGLRTGQVKAVIIDYPVVQGWLKDKANADAFEVAANLNTGEQYGFTVKKGNTELLEAINKALADAKADGTYKKLYEKWIGPYDESAASPTAVRLMSRDRHTAESQPRQEAAEPAPEARRCPAAPSTPCSSPP